MAQFRRSFFIDQDTFCSTGADRYAVHKPDEGKNVTEKDKGKQKKTYLCPDGAAKFGGSVFLLYLCSRFENRLSVVSRQLSES